MNGGGGILVISIFGLIETRVVFEFWKIYINIIVIARLIETRVVFEFGD